MTTGSGPTGPVVIAAGLSNNGHPQVFVTVPMSYTTLDEGIKGAMDYHRMNHAQGTTPQYRVYKATDPDGSELALVEVWDGQQHMVLTGLYKVIAGKFQWANP